MLHTGTAARLLSSSSLPPRAASCCLVYLLHLFLFLMHRPPFVPQSCLAFMLSVSEARSDSTRAHCTFPPFTPRSHSLSSACTHSLPAVACFLRASTLRCALMTFALIRRRRDLNRLPPPRSDPSSSLVVPSSPHCSLPFCFSFVTAAATAAPHTSSVLTLSCRSPPLPSLPSLLSPLIARPLLRCASTESHLPSPPASPSDAPLASSVCHCARPFQTGNRFLTADKHIFNRWNQRLIAIAWLAEQY